MINEHRSQNHTTRREFLLGTAGLAMATLLPACSQTTKTVPIQTTEPKISSLTDQELQVSCSWAFETPLTITVNGVSKAYSMTGWRIGYAGGPEEIMC